MKILIAFLIYLSLIIFINYLLQKDEKYKLAIFIIFSFYSVYFTLGSQVLFGQLEPVSMNSVVFAILICVLFVFNKESLKIGKEYIFFIPLFTYCVFDLFLRVNDYPRYFGIFFIYLSIYLLYLFFKSLFYIDLGKILYSINILALTNGVLCIFQFLTGKKLLIGTFNDSLQYVSANSVTSIRAVGLAGANNAAGTFCALLFGVVLYNLIKRKNLISFISVVLTLISTILTFTRVGYVGIIVETLLFMLFYFPIQRRKFYFNLSIFCFSVLIILCVIFSLKYEIISKLFLERGDTQAARFEQFQRVFDYIVLNHPFVGVGIGQYQSYLYKNFGIFDIDIHSQYLNTLADSGIVIFSLYIWFNFWIARIIIKSSLHRLEKILGISLFVTNIICSNFNPNELYYLNNILYYLIMFAYIFYIKQQTTKI